MRHDGKPADGHFEERGSKYYTEIGDHAARTSGLSAGENALEALEGLIRGPYHRTRFVVVCARRSDR